MSSKKRMPSTQSRKVQVSKQLNNLPEDDQAEIVEEGLKRLPRDERREIVQESMSYSGPIPHYSDFKGYESVLPGSADRILKMSEKLLESKQIQYEFAKLEDLGIEIKLNYEVTGENFKNILEEYDAVYIGTGVWNQKFNRTSSIGTQQIRVCNEHNSARTQIPVKLLK